jgi:hypothetical protein
VVGEKKRQKGLSKEGVFTDQIEPNHPINLKDKFAHG